MVSKRALDRIDRWEGRVTSAVWALPLALVLALFGGALLDEPGLVGGLLIGGLVALSRLVAD